MKNRNLFPIVFISLLLLHTQIRFYSFTSLLILYLLISNYTREEDTSLFLFILWIMMALQIVSTVFFLISWFWQFAIYRIFFTIGFFLYIGSVTGIIVWNGKEGDNTGQILIMIGLIILIAGMSRAYLPNALIFSGQTINPFEQFSWGRALPIFAVFGVLGVGLFGIDRWLRSSYDITLLGVMTRQQQAHRPERRDDVFF